MATILPIEMLMRATAQRQLSDYTRFKIDTVHLLKYPTYPTHHPILEQPLFSTVVLEWIPGRNRARCKF